MKRLVSIIALMTISSAAQAGGGYAGGSLSGAYAEDEFGAETDEGGGLSLQAGYAFVPYFALGARLDGYGFEDGPIDYSVGAAFLEATLSTHRKNRAYGYGALGIGYLNAEAKFGGLSIEDDSAAASLEIGAMFNIGHLSNNNFELGPMFRYTYVDEFIDARTDIWQLGVRLGWNGYPASAW